MKISKLKIKELTVKFSTCLKNNWCDYTLFLSLFLLCFFHALPTGLNADFWPINGDFQNYNPVRRFLNGQIPFRDFSVYLGYGHLVLGSIATFILGLGNPNFATSKMAFCFLSLFSFCVFAYIIFRAILKKQKRTFSLVATNIIILLLLINPNIFSKCLVISDDFYNSIRYSLSAGNSSRFLRGMAPAVFAMLFQLLKFFVSKISLLKKHQQLIQPISLGISTGIIIYYSNDYGLATAICVFLIYTLKIIFSKVTAKEKIKNMVVYFATIVLSFFVFGELITLGHIDSYISKTFGVGGMQLWYYGYWAKNLYIFNIDRTFYELLQGFISLVYLFFFLKSDTKEIDLRFFVPLLLNSTGYAASNEYLLLSGGYLHEVSYSILWLTLVAEFLNAALIFIKKMQLQSFYNAKNKRTIPVIVLGCSIVFAVSVFPLYILTGGGIGEYVYGLGRMNGLATSIISADEFLESDKKVFATYASGLEAHRNQFQPSGYDYIIHVLGYDARKEYLESFHKDDFDYVATIKENFAPWEYWIRNANWFFYRELYKNYKVVWENDYERFWQKKEIIDNTKIESELSIERIKDSKYKIKILSPNIESGFADVKINYNIKKDKSKHSLCTFKTIMKVDNITGYAITKDEHDIAYYLDSKANDLFIGIPISNGYGEVILTSQPERNTYVENFSAEVNDIFVEK